ncbi:hypothetical protein BKA70DRAFT_1465628 [Coprinopsis sp. MPI-PUGE-AT-0042]|nr:hypothetical protein BKA70DRAFT_1465628 [Coprinopsis sp. MPI-PUGE-AT-0042]
MKLSKNFKATSDPAINDVEPSKAFVTEIIEAYERKDPNFTDYYTDNGILFIEGVGTLKDRGVLREFYEWLYKGFEKAVFQVNSVHVTATTTIVTIEGTYFFAKGETKDLSWTLNIERGPTDTKVRALKFYGAVKHIINRVCEDAGPHAASVAAQLA